MVIKRVRFIASLDVTLEFARKSKMNFSRKRKLGFVECLYLMLDMKKTALQNRLSNFMDATGGETVSQQAFCQARDKFNHLPFEMMVRDIVCEEYSGKYRLPLWYGMHVFAVDGSYLQLPKTEELRQEFGTRGPKAEGGEVAEAGISVLYDVFHGFVINPIIMGSDMNERNLMCDHLAYCQEMMPHVAANCVYTIDRGYPSMALFERICQSGGHFVAKCKSDFCEATQNAPLGDSAVTLKNGLKIRVIKFKLPHNGDIVTLATDLFDIPAEEIIELYHRRWGIETMYNRMKNVICVEKFSGRTPNSIRQDFWACMVLMLIMAVLEHEANEKIKAQHNPQNKYEYHINYAQLAVSMRDEFIMRVLLGRAPPLKWYKQFIDRVAHQSKAPIKPNRHFPRNHNRRLATNHYLKSHL
jgi:hypothetical protein